VLPDTLCKSDVGATEAIVSATDNICHDICIDILPHARQPSHMPAKTQHLQIRVTPEQKAALKRQARAAGQDVSSYVLARLTTSASGQFSRILATLGSGSDHRYALAELNDFLHSCPPMAFEEAVAAADSSAVSAISPYLRNYVAAMVEQAANQKHTAPPAWCAEVVPLDAPHFAATLKSLRPHLLRAAPVAFKRRNIFVDAAVGSRV
jgi:hypothetical protein